jgi:hypothetical protein
MANCALTQDYSFGCDVGSGGIIDLWLIEFGSISSLTESSGTITAITKASGKIFRHYQQVIETGQWTEDITGNIQNGTVFYDQKGLININKQQVSIRNEILLLAVNSLVAIVQDQNFTYRLFGRINGLRLLSGSADSGKALGDRNGYQLNLSGKEPQLAPFVQASVIATLQT